MLFNSYAYIFLFLPTALAGFFALHRSPRAARLFLVLASLLFYAYWKVSYLPVLVVSAIVNYRIGTYLGRTTAVPSHRKAWLIAGLAWNLGLLGYFKYTDFLIENVNLVFGSAIAPRGIILPLAISFFTFQKIAYLVDSYRGETRDYDFLNYLLFVSFFPQLIAGPIVHHKEIISQFERPRTYGWNWNNLALGLHTFIIGLAKKVVIADSLAPWANKGFDGLAHLTVGQAWIAALAYTLQLYFDFSGYTDMAIGSARLFNIELPENFRSPYLASDIAEFWRRWHMTLSRFLRDYVYIPLGGNRCARWRQSLNLFLTFLIGGLWHGASWTFVAWGAWHGVGVATHAAWKARGHRLPPWLAHPLTFLYVVFGWVFFRAKTWGEAAKVLRGMAGLGSPAGAPLFSELKLLNVETVNTIETLRVLATLLFALGLVWLAPHTRKLRERLTPSFASSTWLAVLFATALFHLHRVSEFLYFNF